MPRAIECKYHGPTGRKGSRYSAYDHGSGIRVFVATDFSQDFEGNCWRAAEVLLANREKSAGRTLPLPQCWNGASTKTGMVFVPSGDCCGQKWVRQEGATV